MDMKAWLEGLGHTHVKAVTLRIGAETFSGCAYSNNHLDGHEAMVLLGPLPTSYRRSHRTVYRMPGDTRDWFVACYSGSADITEYQPWGRQFVLHPWTCDDPIDRYEEKPYRRIDCAFDMICP